MGLGDFSWQRRADGTVIVSHRAVPVTTLRGAAANLFVARVERVEPDAAQQLMARVTGNFKRGNERRTGRGE